jgi:hypothetical protein
MPHDDAIMTSFERLCLVRSLISLQCSQAGAIHTLYLDYAMSDMSLPICLPHSVFTNVRREFWWFLIGPWLESVSARVLDPKEDIDGLFCPA